MKKRFSSIANASCKTNYKVKMKATSLQSEVYLFVHITARPPERAMGFGSYIKSIYVFACRENNL